MDDITLAQFLKQPEKVQKTIQKYLYGNKNLFPIELTETQLRQFIEETMGGKLDSTYWTVGYELNVYDKLIDNEPLIVLFSDTTDIIEAYWQLACKIAGR